MGEDREKVTLDEESAVRDAVREGDEVEAHAVREGDEREALSPGGDDDVEGHALIDSNLPDANLPDQAVRSE